MTATQARPVFHISGRRWFQRSYGNTYHTVTIYKDGAAVFTSPRSYGYGDMFLQTAVNWLRANGYPDLDYGTRALREELGATYEVNDVARERDL